MAYRVLRSRATDADLGAIFDYLLRTYRDFGDPLDAALDRAEARIHALERHMDALDAAPHQGTLRPDLRPGLRSVTNERAVFYFEVDDDARSVRILAIFFGGQDHQRAMLSRLTNPE